MFKDTDSAKKSIYFLAACFGGRVVNCTFAASAIGSLAQLVQSAALTEQRSLVRAQYDPQKADTGRCLPFFCFGTNQGLLADAMAAGC